VILRGYNPEEVPIISKIYTKNGIYYFHTKMERILMFLVRGDVIPKLFEENA
jgi:hypothetical protein